MRQEHQAQTELPGLPEGGPVEQVREMSEVAALQSQVLDLGLVRESRPVFVYDSKLAKDKKGNAVRQARHREKLQAEGLTMAKVPSSVLEQLKNLGGDWSKFTKPVEVIKEIEVIKEVVREVAVEVVKEVIKEVPGPVVYREKLVEKPVVRLNAEQKKALKIGEKVMILEGWRGNLVRYLLGIQPEKQQKTNEKETV